MQVLQKMKSAVHGPALAPLVPPALPYPSLRELAMVAPIARMPTLDWSLRGIAYHEAGHAVMIHLFRLRQNGAEVGASGGKVHLNPPPPVSVDIAMPVVDLQIAALRIAAVFLAGVMAQMLKDGIGLEGVLLDDSSDWRRAGQVLDGAEIPGSATGRLFYCQKLAMAMLSRRWCTVVAVAEALEYRSSLTAYEVATLCEGGRLRYHA